MSNFEIKYAGPADEALLDRFVAIGNVGENARLVDEISRVFSDHLTCLDTNREATVQVNGTFLGDGALSMSVSTYIASNDIANQTMKKQRGEQ